MIRAAIVGLGWWGKELVRVIERFDGYDPELAEVRDAVEQKWRTQKRHEFQGQAYDQLLAKYEIVLPSGTVEPGP